MPKLLPTDLFLSYFLKSSNNRDAKTNLGALFQCFTIFTSTLPTLAAPVARTVIANALLESSRKPVPNKDKKVIVGHFQLKYPNNLEKERSYVP